jgi:hypothetical protein
MFAVFGILMSSDEPPNALIVSLSLANISLSVATTVFCTLLIAYRIWTVSRTPGGSVRSHRSAHFALRILIESGAVYSVTALIFIPMDALAPKHIITQTYYLYAGEIFAFMAVSTRRWFFADSHFNRS